MAKFYFGLGKNDDYFTTKETWRMIAEYVPKESRVYEPFYSEHSKSKEYLNELGYADVLYENRDFFADPPDPDSYDVIVTNPPFSKKAEVMRKLKEIDKPFVVTLPSTAIGSNFLRQFEDLQVVVPYGRLHFQRVNPETNRLEDLRNACFTSVFVCRGMDLPKDLIWLRKPPSVESAEEAAPAPDPPRKEARGSKRSSPDSETDWFNERFALVRAEKRKVYDLNTGEALKLGDFARLCKSLNRRATGASWLKDEGARTYDAAHPFHPRSATRELFTREGAPFAAFRDEEEDEDEKGEGEWVVDPEDERAVIERVTSKRSLVTRRFEWSAGWPADEGGLLLRPREELLNAWTEIVREGVCGGEAERFEAVLDWLADCVRRPARRPTSTLVLSGAGAWHTKRVFTDWLAKCFGDRYVELNAASDSRAVVGKLVSVTRDVSFKAERKSLSAHLSQAVLTIRRKKGTFTVPNVLRAVVITGESVPETTTSSEFVVVRADERFERDIPWSKLDEDLRNGGDRSLLFNLARRKKSERFVV